MNTNSNSYTIIRCVPAGIRKFFLARDAEQECGT
mgnify:CR=1 FL=1